MLRLAALLLFSFYAADAALAQSAQEIGQMRVYIQQLEERLRQLTGQNEQLTYEVNQLRAQLGHAGVPGQTGAIAGQPQTAMGEPIPSNALPAAGTTPQDAGNYSIAADDPLIAPDGGEPVDLSVLAGGGAIAGDPNAGLAAPAQPAAPAGQQTAVLGAPGAAAALSGSARDEYDLAYGYILTGEYEQAEQSFGRWLAAFPDDPQAADAQFWLAESHFQQGAYRDAANTFLAVYKASEQGPKAPEALLKLGMSLSALGERNAACATLAEVDRRYPDASASLISRVDAEIERAGC